MSPWVGRAAVAILVWAGAALGAFALDARPHLGLLAAVVAALAGALWLLLDLAGSTETIGWPGDAAPQPVRPPGEDARFERLHRIIVQHQTSHEVGYALQRQLAAVTDQRLLLHHGITREAAPERAAELLGPDLTRFLTARPPHPRLSTVQIDVLLQRIETL